MSKLIKEKEPRYCKICGKELRLTKYLARKQFDEHTGKDDNIYKFYWTCPDARRFFWEKPHTYVERYGRNLEDALTQQEYDANFYCT